MLRLLSGFEPVLTIARFTGNNPVLGLNWGRDQELHLELKVMSLL